MGRKKGARVQGGGSGNFFRGEGMEMISYAECLGKVENGGDSEDGGKCWMVEVVGNVDRGEGDGVGKWIDRG